jgi:siroheme synthase
VRRRSTWWLAAPLAAGIPVTHRNSAASLGIVTGHECRDQESRLDWAGLATLQTLVFLMGVSNVGKIAGRLIENGKSADTPAALIHRAFWPGQRVLTATLGTIAAEAARAGIEAPATLVVGEVVRLHEKLCGAALLSDAVELPVS